MHDSDYRHDFNSTKAVLALSQKEVSNNSISIDMMVEMENKLEKEVMTICVRCKHEGKTAAAIADLTVELLTTAADQRMFGADNLQLLMIGDVVQNQPPFDASILKVTVVQKNCHSLTNALKNMYKLNFNLQIAIDVTSSNLNQKDISDLHNFDMLENNLYLKIIDSIGQKIYKLDDNNKMTFYLFGHYEDQFSKFNSNGSIKVTTIEAESLEQVKEKYIKMVKNLKEEELFGDVTCFEDFTKQFILKHEELVADIKKLYSILLIITDGILGQTEMNKFIDLIFSMEEKSISIIIVGVGEADFSDMERLDGDAGEDGLPSLKNSRGERVKRDIVQFVEFKQYPNVTQLQERILQELPDQILSYFKLASRK